MVAFIDVHRECYRVESICRQLPIAPLTYYEYKAREADPERLPPRVRRDEALKPAIRRVWEVNYGVYGARKVWRQLNREQIPVARNTVERLMGVPGFRVRCAARLTRPPSRTLPLTVPRRPRAAAVPGRAPQPAVGGGFYLCCHLGGRGLRGLRHRRLCPLHRWLAGSEFDAHGPGAGCPGAGAVVKDRNRRAGAS